MRFSIIMPSLLVDYPGTATKKEQKIIRAINSVLAQSFSDFELIVIADGCHSTSFIVRKQYALPGQFSFDYPGFTDNRIKLYSVKRNGLWSNNARNAGIKAAKGEYIIYLDIDDQYGPDHLKTFADNIKGEDWVYSNDWMMHEGKWVERQTDITQYGRCGTSNLCHAARLGLTWDKTGYGHDYHFIQQLRAFENNKHIPTAQYHVCHIGGAYDI